MVDKIRIYDNGQVYEIDSDLIYVPKFEKKADTVSEYKDKDVTEPGTT